MNYIHFSESPKPVKIFELPEIMYQKKKVMYKLNEQCMWSVSVLSIFFLLLCTRSLKGLRSFFSIPTRAASSLISRCFFSQ